MHQIFKVKSVCTLRSNCQGFTLPPLLTSLKSLGALGKYPLSSPPPPPPPPTCKLKSWPTQLPSFVCQWSQERHFVSMQHWHDQCQTVQSELHTPLPPKTGGEVDVQQWGGRHSHFLIMCPMFIGERGATQNHTRMSPQPFGHQGSKRNR